MRRLVVPGHLLAAGADVADQLTWLAEQGRGIKLRRMNVGGRGLVWVAELEGLERGGWGHVLAKALHSLLQELALDQRGVA